MRHVRRITYGISILFLLIPLLGYAGDEVEIDLDSLEEKPGAAPAAAVTEPLLPVTVPMEQNKNSLWILAGLAILLPAATLLIPVRISKTPQKNRPQGIEASLKKES